MLFSKCSTFRFVLFIIPSGWWCWPKGKYSCWSQVPACPSILPGLCTNMKPHLERKKNKNQSKDCWGQCHHCFNKVSKLKIPTFSNECVCEPLWTISHFSTSSNISNFFFSITEWYTALSGLSNTAQFFCLSSPLLIFRTCLRKHNSKVIQLMEAVKCNWMVFILN